MKAHHARDWATRGYTLVQGLLDPIRLQDAQTYMDHRFTPENPCRGFGTDDNSLEFPTGTPLDHLSLDEHLIAACRTLLRTPHILLSQSSAWSKGHQGKNNDQRMHMDANHSFLHPPAQPDAVAAIIYFDDTTRTGGPTAVVPRDTCRPLYTPPYIAMPGMAQFPFFNDRTRAENYFDCCHPETGYFRSKLYANEHVVHAQPGDVLLYRLDVWHRGTPVYPHHVRRVLNLIFKRADAHHIYTWNAGFARRNYYGVSERLFCQLSPNQRTALGVPPVGHPYWTPTTLSWTRDRYAGAFDVTPYTSKL